VSFRVSQFQAEAKLLATSLLPVFGSATMDPRHKLAAVTVMSADIFQPNSAPTPPVITPTQSAGFPIVSRGWSEECDPSTNSSGLCAHIVVVNTFRYAPVTFTLRVKPPIHLWIS
jgi:hypothetical protein